MMGKVVVHADAPFDSTLFHAAAYALEHRKSVDSRSGVYAGVPRGSDRGEGVHPVMFACERPLNAAS